VKAAHLLARGKQPGEQAHGLKELEREGFPGEPVPDLIGGYSKIVCPALGGHCLRTSFLCGVLTTSWLKLFIDA